MDKIKAFKNELRCYGYYKNQINQIKKELEANMYLQTGVSGVKYDKIPCHSSEEAMMERKLSLIEEGHRIQNELDRYVSQVKHIEEVLSKMPRTLSDAMIDIYSRGKTYEEVCLKINWSSGGLYKAINKVLRKIL